MLKNLVVISTDKYPSCDANSASGANCSVAISNTTQLMNQIETKCNYENNCFLDFNLLSLMKNTVDKACPSVSYFKFLFIEYECVSFGKRPDGGKEACFNPKKNYSFFPNLRLLRNVSYMQ